MSPSFRQVGHADGQWGRQRIAVWQNSVQALVMMVCCPVIVILYWIALEHYGGSLTITLQKLALLGPIDFSHQLGPRTSIQGLSCYAVWLSWQLLMYTHLPGSTCFGQRTPGGHLLSYKTNGLASLIVSLCAYTALSITGLLDPAVIANNWPTLLVAVNCYAFTLSFGALLKGYIAPTFLEDSKLSGT